MPSLIGCSEAYFRDVDCDVSLFDDNGNTVYSKGERTFTYEEVSIIRRVLEHDYKDTFLLSLQGVGYICVRSTDMILYGKGYFNDGAEHHTGACRGSSPAKDMGQEVTSKEGDMYVSDIDRTEDESINHGKTVGCTSDNKNKLNEVIAEGPTSGPADEKHVNYQTHVTSQLNLLHKARLSIKQCKKSENVVSFAAMLVNNYLIMMHGSNSGHVSWLHVLSTFRAKVKQY